MQNRLHCSLQILQSPISVLYAWPTDLATDVMASPDDVYLSASAGCGKLICAAAGQDTDGESILQREVRKFTFPLPVGSVVVTSAGRLNAKYVFHVAALDFTTPLDAGTFFPRMVQNLFERCAILQQDRLLIPLIIKTPSADAPTPQYISSLSGLSAAQTLQLLLQSLACYLALKPCTVHTIQIVFYHLDAGDHAAVEATLVQELAPIVDQITIWNAAAGPINSRMAHLLPLVALATDPALHTAVTQSIEADRQALHQLFVDEQQQASEGLWYGTVGQPSNPLTPVEYDQRHNRLMTTLQNFNDEIEHKTELIRVLNERHHNLEMQQALKGGETPFHVSYELETIQRDIDHHTRQLASFTEALAQVEADLAVLERRAPAGRNPSGLRGTLMAIRRVA
jgi:hypothetical protein